jgi:hypothetical protein
VVVLFLRDPDGVVELVGRSRSHPTHNTELFAVLRNVGVRTVVLTGSH